MAIVRCKRGARKMPTALIWGASGGIGSALVRHLKANAWQVIGVARDESRVPPEADHALEFDSANAYSYQQAAYAIAQQTDALDWVVYAAGVMHAAAVADFPSDDWGRVLDVNLTGAQRAVAASLDLVREGGAIMFLGAYVEKIAFPRFGAYAAAKAGLSAFAGVLAKEQRKLKITVVRPGAVDTPFWQNLPFALPKGALTAEAVAEAMLAHYQAGGAGQLDL